jgi:hypothetical protein
METTPESSFIEVFEAGGISQSEIQKRIQGNRSEGFETIFICDYAAFLQDRKGSLREVLNFLYNEDLTDADKFSEMPSYQRSLYDYRRLVIGRFIQVEINSKFKVKTLNRIWKNAVEPEVQLWTKTLTMLERLYTLRFLPHHPALSFLALIQERALLLSNCLDEDSIEGIEGKKSFIAKMQRQNRQIQGYENPFDAEEYPYTSQILKIAQEVAQESDRFKKGQFNPVYRARMTVVTRLNDSNGKMRCKGKVIRQSRSVSDILSLEN